MMIDVLCAESFAEELELAIKDYFVAEVSRLSVAHRAIQYGNSRLRYVAGVSA